MNIIFLQGFYFGTYFGMFILTIILIILKSSHKNKLNGEETK